MYKRILAMGSYWKEVALFKRSCRIQFVEATTKTSYIKLLKMKLNQLPLKHFGLLRVCL